MPPLFEYPSRRRTTLPRSETPIGLKRLFYQSCWWNVMKMWTKKLHSSFSMNKFYNIVINVDKKIAQLNWYLFSMIWYLSESVNIQIQKSMAGRINFSWCFVNSQTVFHVEKFLKENVQFHLSQSCPRKYEEAQSR